MSGLARHERARSTARAVRESLITLRGCGVSMRLVRPFLSNDPGAMSRIDDALALDSLEHLKQV